MYSRFDIGEIALDGRVLEITFTITMTHVIKPKHPVTFLGKLSCKTDIYPVDPQFFFKVRSAENKPGQAGIRPMVCAKHRRAWMARFGKRKLPLLFS